MVTKLFRNDIRVISADLQDNIPIETLIDVVQLNKVEVFQNSKQIVAVYVSKYVNFSRANCITILQSDDF